MPQSDSNARDLLTRIGRGEDAAIPDLLEPHRQRLHRMVSARLTSALAARVDPSDVVQEAMTEAARRLAQKSPKDCIPFYPWLRQIAFDRLVDLHRHHVKAARRSVSREVTALPLSQNSESNLTLHLFARDKSPSEYLVRRELQQRVHDALNRLSASDRDVLVLRHLEQLSIEEVAAVLGITEAAAQSRYRRSLERLHALLDGTF